MFRLSSIRRFSEAAVTESRALVVGDGATTAVRSAIRAACECAGSVDVLLLGSISSKAASEAARWEGVQAVTVGRTQGSLLAEHVAPLILSHAKAKSHTHILAPASTFGKNLLPRVAGMLGVSAISDITAVDSSSNGCIFTRPIYAGNALATVSSSDPVKILTVRATAFEPVPAGTGEAPVEEIPEEKVREAAEGGSATRVRWVGEDKTISARPDLTTAGVVVAGGRGLKNGENFKMLEEMADKLGGAVGATRAAVDAGYVPNDMQIGQTGKIVAPELYIAVGLSGAIQHLAGMKDSKIIVAINKDPDAPIFQVADYGLVADLFDVDPALSKRLAEAKAKKG